MDQSNGDLLSDLHGNEESVTVRAELSTVLEESVESLSAAVGGWSSELARSSERASRLEATIASLSAAMETWKADMARTSARAEERLLRALEILESRMAQHQAIATEIRESQGSSASWLTRAMEEWKAEIRYGSGLTEVRLLSAVESLEAKLTEVQEAGTEVREQLSSATSELGNGIAERLSTIQAVQDETRAWFEAAATAVGNDAQVALGRLRDLIGAVDSLKGDLRQLAAEAAAAQAETKAALMGRLNEVVGDLSDASSAATADRIELRRDVNTLRETLVSELGAVRVALTGAVEDAGGLQGALGASLQQQLEAAGDSLKQELSQVQAVVREELSALRTAVNQVLEADPGALSPESEARLLRALEAIEGGVAENKSLGSGVQQQVRAASELFAERIGQLETKLTELLADQQAVAGAEPGADLEGMIGELGSAVRGWHDAVGAATAGTESKLVRSLEAIEAAIERVGVSVEPAAADERLTARIDELEARIAFAHEEGNRRHEQLAESVRKLVQSIDDWRAKGRQAADRNKERVSGSLEALEARILENREDEADYRDMMRKELAALTEAVDNLGDQARDSAKLMRGLEELDEGLMRQRDELSHLADTFEAQFEIFEARVGDSVAARLDELERRIQERNKALVTLLMGPRPESAPTTVEEAPRRHSHSEPRTSAERPGQQARRRR